MNELMTDEEVSEFSESYRIDVRLVLLKNGTWEAECNLGRWNGNGHSLSVGRPTLSEAINTLGQMLAEYEPYLPPSDG